MIPTKPRKVVCIELTPDDHLENMPSFNRPVVQPEEHVVKSEELPDPPKVTPKPSKNNL